MQRIVPLLCLILLTSCSLVTGLTLNSAEITPATTITLASSQPRTLDPARTLGDAGSAVGHIFSGLVVLDQNLEIEPELAHGWDVNDDGTVYTFFLDPDAAFHNGQPVTAQDVKFSWERALNPSTQSDTAGTYLADIVGARDVLAGSAETLSGVQVIDDHILEVTIDAPKPYFLAKLTYPVSFIVDAEQVNDTNWEYDANGTGPFMLNRWRDDEIILLDKNPSYYKPTGNVEQIVYQLDVGLRLSEFENGNIDLVGIGDAAIERVRDPNDPLTGNIFTQPSLCTTFVGLNNLLPPLDDVRVRQALNYALDKERLAAGLFGDRLLPASGILPPGIPGATAQTAYQFDPDRAQQLLREANIDTSQPLIFTSSGYSTLGTFASTVIAMWEENLDLTIEAELLEPFRYSDVLYGGESGHFFSYGWCADYLDPENFLSILFESSSQQNWGRYANPEIDALLQQAGVEQDVDLRMMQYEEIEDRLLADAPYVFVGHSLSTILVNPRITDYTFTPIGIPQWHRVTVSEN